MFGKPWLALPKLHFWGRSRTFGVVRKDPKNWGRGIPGITNSLYCTPGSAHIAIARKWTMYFNIYFLLKTGSFSSNRHVSLPEGSPSWKLHPFAYCSIWVFPKIMVSPNHPILIGFSIINHPFWGTPIFGNIHIVKPLPVEFPVWKSRQVRDVMRRKVVTLDLVAPRCLAAGSEFCWSQPTKNGTYCWWKKSG